MPGNYQYIHIKGKLKRLLSNLDIIMKLIAKILMKISVTWTKTTFMKTLRKTVASPFAVTEKIISCSLENPTPSIYFI